MTLPPAIIPPAHPPARRKSYSPARRAAEENSMTVVTLDEKGEPLAPADMHAPAGHHPYTGMPGVSGMVRPGMLLDIIV